MWRPQTRTNQKVNIFDGFCVFISFCLKINWIKWLCSNRVNGYVMWFLYWQKVTGTLISILFADPFSWDWNHICFLPISTVCNKFYQYNLFRWNCHIFFCYSKYMLLHIWMKVELKLKYFIMNKLKMYSKHGNCEFIPLHVVS